MFLSALLSNKGFVPTIRTIATVHLEAGPTITRIELEAEAQVPGIDEATFQQLAEDAKAKCPVSKALAGPEITLRAKLLK
jgi:osmotically inducible protein OsmC